MYNANWVIFCLLHHVKAEAVMYSNARVWFKTQLLLKQILEHFGLLQMQYNFLQFKTEKKNKQTKLDGV